MPEKGIPIIDFEKCSLNRENVTKNDLTDVGEELYKTFSTYGFAYVKNVGIESSEVDQIFSNLQKFYDLDIEIKMKYKMVKTFFGYVPINFESSQSHCPHDYMESFAASSEFLNSEDKQWPDEHLPGFSKSFKDFGRKSQTLSYRFMNALAEGMQLKDKNYFHWMHAKLNKSDNYSYVRSNYYLPIPENYEPLPGQTRLAEHADHGSFTLLFQDSVGGLQIQDLEGKYFDASTIPGTMLVFIGQVLQAWTGGRLKATKHKIVTPDDPALARQGRHSLIYFVRPDNDKTVEEIEYESALKETYKKWENEAKEVAGKLFPEFAHSVHAYADADEKLQAGF